MDYFHQAPFHCQLRRQKQPTALCVCAYQCEIETPRAIVGFAEIDQTQRSTINHRLGRYTYKPISMSRQMPYVCHVWELLEPVHRGGSDPRGCTPL